MEPNVLEPERIHSRRPSREMALSYRVWDPDSHIEFRLSAGSSEPICNSADLNEDKIILVTFHSYENRMCELNIGQGTAPERRNCYPFAIEKFRSLSASLAQYNRPIDSALSKIAEFQNRTDGWKGPNSLAPTKTSVDDAKTFANVVLADQAIEPPHIGLAADGEINFFWQNAKVTIDLSISGDGTYAYFAKPISGSPFFEDAAPVSKNLPREILELIRLQS